MGTRGCYGFRKNGIDKLTYNHFDSYPSYLGKIILEFFKETSLDEMNEIYDRLIMVDEGGKPTPEQIEECKKYYDENVSKQTPEEWYCLLRKVQGKPNEYKHGLRYMTDDGDFIKDSLCCEYAYIINLDTKQLEFWKGFQHKPDPDNRYGTNPRKEYSDNYYPCKLTATYSLIPYYIAKRDVDKTIADMEKKSGY